MAFGRQVLATQDELRREMRAFYLEVRRAREERGLGPPNEADLAVEFGMSFELSAELMAKIGNEATTLAAIWRPIMLDG